MEKKEKRRRPMRTTLARHGQVLAVAGDDAARRGSTSGGGE
jgi:hypothetical protein